MIFEGSDVCGTSTTVQRRLAIYRFTSRECDQRLRPTQSVHRPGSAGVTQVTGFSQLKVDLARTFVKLGVNA